MCLASATVSTLVTGIRPMAGRPVIPLMWEAVEAPARDLSAETIAGPRLLAETSVGRPP